VGPRAGLEAVAKRKIPSSCPEWKICRRSRSLVTILTELSRFKKEGKGKVVPVFNEAPRHEDVLGEWRYSYTHSLTSALDGGQ
jgi:hypothetical protein